MNEREQLELVKIMASASRQSITRRELLRRAGIGAGAMSMGAWLAACGIGGEETPPPAVEPEDTLTTTEIQGTLDFANWPLYIDKLRGESPTIQQFQEETDITVNYDEVIEDNQSFFGRVREPLAQGRVIEWDMFVVTDWLIGKMAGQGWLERLDHARLDNFAAHAGDIYKNPSYDPGNAHSIPWQSGITGIGYNPELTGREITSFDDLFDPAFAGQVGMFTEMRDTMNLTLLGLGVDPQTATVEDAERAQEKLLEQRDAGIVRQYYGNEYADALARGDLAVTMAWSGDIFQLQFDEPDLQFVVPEEGGVLWVDNMAIAQNAPHPIDAMEFMNFVYRPEIAAQIVAWVQFICPVPEAQEILANSDDEEEQLVAESPLVFPTPEMEARLHSYKTLDEDEETEWNRLFNEVIQG